MPLLGKSFSHSIESTKDFKEKFLKNRSKFDPKTHEIISFDAKSLYTYTNIKMTVEYIVTEIYKEPSKYFDEGHEVNKQNGKKFKIPYPPKRTFQKFIMAVLTKFNSFSSVNGFYTQIDGLSMGSKLSPLISNLYCNLMEQKIISKWLNKGIVVNYQRYVDDIFLCIKKNNHQNLLNESNNFDKRY